MGKANSFIKNTKGQLNINLAVAAILGLILSAAFLVIGIIVLQGVFDVAAGTVDEGCELYDALDNITNSSVSSILLATLLIGSIGVVMLLLLFRAAYYVANLVI
jgi:hypothetical protein